MKSNTSTPTRDTTVKSKKSFSLINWFTKNEMVETFGNAWKIADLRKKLLFTLMIVLLYRIGANLYVPFVNITAIQSNAYISQMTSGIFGMVNLFSGGAFEQVLRRRDEDDSFPSPREPQRPVEEHSPVLLSRN